MKQSAIMKTGFVAALVALVFIVFMSHWYMSQWTISDQRESYTFDIIQRMDRLLYALRDVSKSQHSYSRTGKVQYLESYREAQGNVDRELASLNSLAVSHQKLRLWLLKIEPLVREKLSQRQRALETVGGEAPPEVAGKSRVSTDEIRRQVAAAQDEAILDLRELSARQVADLKRVQKLLVANAVIIFILICLVFQLFRRDIARRLRSEQDLIENRDRLELLVKTRTREVEGANQQLHLERKLVEQTRRDLDAHQDAIREEERLAISREVHDEIGQNLTALKLDLSWMQHRFPSGEGELAARVKEMLARLDQLIDTTRHISAELRPPMLDHLGLAAAIEWQAGDFRRRSGIECDLMLNEGLEVSCSQVATNLLRIFQEALTNIIRHARASQVFITLCQRADSIILEISDNGRGITGEEMDSATAYGIMGMRERARLCSGELSIKGKPEEGTTLRLAIPLSAAKEES